MWISAMQYETYFQAVTHLSSQTKQQMAMIYFKHYQGSNEARFYSDLMTKDEVLFLVYEQQIVGFSTLQYYPFAGNMIVYSGDTIVEPNHWRQKVLHKAWIERMGSIKKQFPTTPVYWFLLVKGYKTFKYLVLFAKHFYPHWQDQDNQLAQLANQLATDKFGDLYCDGVVECPEDYGYLKPELATLTHAEKQRHSAKYFLEANPLYYKGHELVCLCELSRENLNPKFVPWFDEAKVVYHHD